MQDSSPTKRRASVPDLKVNVTLAEGNGQLWIGTNGGARSWDGPRAERTSQSTDRTLSKDHSKTR